MWFKDNKDVQQTTLHAGADAESYAERYLQQQGLKSYTKNYRAKTGEIDLIMTQGDTLVFIEVRLRRNPFFSSAAETVDYRKQQKIIKTAQVFLQQQHLIDKVPCRFDVVAIDNNPKDPAAIHWIKNAFGA